MEFDEWMENVVRAFEIVGVVILALGSIWALAGSLPLLFARNVQGAYESARQSVGRSILLGLEVLIIADIVKTITIDPTLDSAATLGLLVLIRTFLSFSIEIELYGVVPWRRTTRKDGRGTNEVDLSKE